MIRINKPMGDTIFSIICYGVLSVCALSCLIPMLHLIALSLSDFQAVTSGWVTLWPIGWSLESYKGLLVGTNILQAFYNSVVITVIGVMLSMLFTILAAYPLSRRYMIGRRFFTLAIVFTMLFGGGLIPTYLVIKSLGLVNSFGSIWLLHLIGPFNMLVMKSFFESIPDEMEEAARIDGCGEIRLVWQIFLPLSMPMIATLSLFYGVGYWNAFMNVLIYLNDSNKMNLMVLVQQMVQNNSLLDELAKEDLYEGSSKQLVPDMIKSAGLMVLVVPMLSVYPFLQKYFIKGVMIGAIKG
ncbi:MAG: carbohydrate transporter permease [Paenibacillus sp.]|nr:carbohydrate transporter permease [Paenibacillus sp.]